MNEHIKELALKSGFAHEPKLDQLWVDGSLAVMISPSLEKFAELIIRECTEKIHYCQQNDIDFIEKHIKAHFGVEQ